MIPFKKGDRVLCIDSWDEYGNGIGGIEEGRVYTIRQLDEVTEVQARRNHSGKAIPGVLLEEVHRGGSGGFEARFRATRFRPVSTWNMK